MLAPSCGAIARRRLTSTYWVLTQRSKAWSAMRRCSFLNCGFSHIGRDQRMCLPQPRLRLQAELPEPLVELAPGEPSENRFGIDAIACCKPLDENGDDQRMHSHGTLQQDAAAFLIRAEEQEQGPAVLERQHAWVGELVRGNIAASQMRLGGEIGLARFARDRTGAGVGLDESLDRHAADRSE